MLFLIVGKSGAGKSEIVNELTRYGYKPLLSYTTRPKRNTNDNTHVFITIEEYENFKKNNEIVAYTFFDSHHYFSTFDQLAHSDLYVVDPDGVRYLKEKVKDIRFVTIYIDVDNQTRIERMRKRGDSEDAIMARLANDEIKFKNIEYDYVVPNYNLNKAVKVIKSIIEIETDEDEENFGGD